MLVRDEGGVGKIALGGELELHRARLWVRAVTPP